MKKRGINVEIARKVRITKGLKETRLQKIRYFRKMTQQQLADESGVSLRMIAAYEQKDKAIEGAKLNTLCDICLALDCGIEDILEDRNIANKYKQVKKNG